MRPGGQSIGSLPCCDPPLAKRPYPGPLADQAQATASFLVAETVGGGAVGAGVVDGEADPVGAGFGSEFEAAAGQAGGGVEQGVGGEFGDDKFGVMGCLPYLGDERITTGRYAAPARIRGPTRG